MPGDMSQVDGRVGRWALGFDKLMEDPAGLGCFKVHTQKIIWKENGNFGGIKKNVLNTRPELELENDESVQHRLQFSQ